MDWIGQIALATLLVGLFAWLRADLAALRRESRADLAATREELWAGIQKQGAEARSGLAAVHAELRSDISLVNKEVAGLRERMARVEGLLEGLRDAVTGRQAA